MTEEIKRIPRIRRIVDDSSGGVHSVIADTLILMAKARMDVVMAAVKAQAVKAQVETNLCKSDPTPDETKKKE